MISAPVLPIKILLAALLLRPAPASAAPTDLDILRRRLEIYQVLWPHPVDDALASFKRPVYIDVACPDDPLPDGVPDVEGGRRFLPAQTVRISVRTFPAAWKPKKHGRDGGNGNYTWHLPQSYDASGRREEVRAENELALDPRVTEGLRGESARSQVPSVVLLYHELLHSQLMIDAMREDENWQGDFCSFHREEAGERRMMGASDNEHRLIPALEEKFREVLEKVAVGRESEGQNPWAPLAPSGKTR